MVKQLPTHLKEMNQRAIHDTLARADFGAGRRRCGAIAAFAGCFDRREILLVIVAVSQEKQVFEPRSAFQIERMPTEKLAGDADETDPPVEQGYGQMGPHAFSIFALVKGD